MKGPRPLVIATVLRAAGARLAAAGVVDPGRDARRLMPDVLGISTAGLAARLPDPITAQEHTRFETLVDMRAARQPLSQIVGKRAFFGRDFVVSGDVLDPRPDTETLVEHALAAPFSRVLDLGTGSGCILISLLAERTAATGVGTDDAPAALDVARVNARALGVADRAAFTRANWFSGLSGQFDLIVSNPPYIARDEMADLAPEVRDWEPRMALTDNGDGLGAYRAIAAGAGAHLAPGGRVLVEIVPTQATAVQGYFAAAGFSDTRVFTDLDGRDRVIAVRR